MRARAAGLFTVLLASRIIALWGRSVPISIWTPFALLWQDVAVVLVYIALDLMIRPPRIAWIAYGVLVVYTAINVPVARLLSSPLSWPMLRATRGTLADSIRHHVTGLSVGLVSAVISIGVVTPLALRGFPRRGRRALFLVALGVLPLGYVASHEVDTRGWDRNAFSILLTTAFPRVSDLGLHEAPADWRRSPIEATAFPDGAGVAGEEVLARFRGRARGRNVVCCFLESTGAEYLDPYGASEDPMPRLGELFGKALVFDAAYTTCPESIKSLIGILCARYPAIDTRAEAHAKLRTPSLAEILRDEGYRTGLFHSGRFMYLGMDDVLRDRGFEVLEDAGDIGGERESSFGVGEEAAVARVLDWIDEGTGDRPFFVAYLPVAGHHPYDTPEAGPFPDANDRGRYLNALRYADAAVGALVDGLRERGELDNTLLAFFGDHGEAFGQHDGNYGHSLFIYEENVRVPLLFVLPGLIETEHRSSVVASLIDVSPTILDLLGLPAPAECQGSSLLDGRPRLALFFADYSRALVGLRDGPWKYIAELGGQGELYQLRRDPGEREELGGSQSDRARAYRSHLEAWASEQRRRVQLEGSGG